MYEMCAKNTFKHVRNIYVCSKVSYVRCLMACVRVKGNIYHHHHSHHHHNQAPTPPGLYLQRILQRGKIFLARRHIDCYMLQTDRCKRHFRLALCQLSSYQMDRSVSGMIQKPSATGNPLNLLTLVTYLAQPPDQAPSL